MQNFLALVCIVICIDFGHPCALPFWWSEQYHFPPYYPTGQPKSTYKYRETLHHADPNNFIHVKEYSEYTWWEHEASKVHVPVNDYPQEDLGDGMTNVFFTKDGRFKGFYPHNQYGFNNGINPHRDTNNIVPRGDNNFHPSDTNNIVPAEKTDRISPTSGTTSRSVPTVSSPTSTTATVFDEEREVNENEGTGGTSRVANIEGNNLDDSGSESRASYKLPEDKKSNNFWGGWFGKKNPNETEPCKVSESDINSLRSMIEKMFNAPREHELHPESKEKAREDILHKFRDLGLQVWTQNFTTPPMKNEVSF